MNRKTDPIRRLAELMDGSDVRWSFSRHCCSGIVHLIGKTCQCWRCRRQRGEPANDETERVAAEIQAEARADLGLK